MITRHENNGILQGFTFYSYPEKLHVVVHEAGLWHAKISYYGTGQFGASNQNLQVSAFSTPEEADQFIVDNGLIFSGNHLWQTESGLRIYTDNAESEESPVIISAGKIIQPEAGVKMLWGEPEQIMEYIMAEDYDISELPTWESLMGTLVKKGKLVRHNDKPYICNIEHTVQSDWQPGVAETLWFTRYPDDVIAEWSSFASHEFQAMPIGTPVMHNDITYYLINQGQGFREPGSQYGHFGWSTTQP